MTNGYILQFEKIKVNKSRKLPIIYRRKKLKSKL